MPHIRPARAEDLPVLAELALRSKAHWGYDAAFLEACRAELTLVPGDLVDSRVWVIDGPGGAPIGMVQLTPRGDRAELHKLFVDPAHMGRGLGKALMHHAVAAARHAGARQIAFDADPGAAPFYDRMGAVQVGEVPSGSIPGRVLPHYVLAL